jgi:colicin import membrane protein
MQMKDELRFERRLFYAWLVAAVVLHVVVVVGLLHLQTLDVRMHRPLHVVSVSLVSLPVTPEPDHRPERQPVASETVVPPVLPSPVKITSEPKPSQPLTVSPVVPKDAMKAVVSKTPVRSPVSVVRNDPVPNEHTDFQAALEKLRKKDAESKLKEISEPSNLGSTLTSLQKKVADMTSGNAAGGHYINNGGGVSDAYKAKITEIIQRNWSFSNRLIRSASGMEVYVSIFVLPDGSVSQIRYERKSASEYLNSSVRAALEKSVPFPPLPRESGSNGLWIGFFFTPEGIGQ